MCSSDLLLTNTELSDKVADSIQTLKHTPINSIRRYLIERNLLQIGSAAPESVIRSIYENSVLSGDVHNTSSREDTAEDKYEDKYTDMDTDKHKYKYKGADADMAGGSGADVDAPIVEKKGHAKEAKPEPKNDNE